MREFIASLAFVVFAATFVPARGQNLPHIGYVYPAGGKQGSTFKITIGGQFLGGATNLIISGGGISASVEDYARPMTQREFNELREQVEQLKKKRDSIQSRKGRGNGSAAARWTAEDERLFAEVRKKLATFQRRPPNPAIAETVTLKVSIAPDAVRGDRELRLRTVGGLSNPMLFKVGHLPEYAEKPETTKEERPAAYKRHFGEQQVNPPEMHISAPAVVNGQIMAGDVDRIKFRARQGQRLVIAASARELVPYLPDAVPGWFQATLRLLDSKGQEIGYDDDFRFNPDPVLFFTVPRDGEYAVEIRDSIFRGREDFVYRLEIGETPFVTSSFPLGAPSGKEATVKVAGWNLQNSQLMIPPSGGDKVQPIQVREGEDASNIVPFERGELPETLEQEPNNSPAEAPLVSAPIVINGRIDSPGDLDAFRFQGKAGAEFVCEVTARRLNSPLDSTLRLIGPDGSQVAFNDDFEDKAAGLTTHQADSRFSIKLPGDGLYIVELADGQRKGGSEYSYRLRLSEPQPDFELRIVPSSVTIRAGGTVPLTVYALRKDGFDGEILLSIDGDEDGFLLVGGRMPAGTDKVKVTLTAPASRKQELTPLRIEGRAISMGKVVTRQVVPAEDMMQAFFYRHLVPSKELLVCVNGASPQRWPIRMVSNGPVKIPSGGTASVRFAVPKYAMERAKLELVDAPEGITIKKVGEWQSGAEITLACEGDKAKPGLKGNLIFEPSAIKAQNAKTGSGRSSSFGSLPAVPFEVVEP